MILRTGSHVRLLRVNHRTNANTDGTKDIFDLLGCYTAYIGSYLPTFRDNLSVPSSRTNCPRSLTVEDRTERLYRNVDN
jgi:hypothetical protein